MCKHLKGTLCYWERFTCFFTENVETQMSRGPVGHHRWVRFSVLSHSPWRQQHKNLRPGWGQTCVLHAHLVSVHHEVVCGYQGFEDHHPAGIADPLHQRVDHLGHVHVGLVLGGLDQVWRRNEVQRGSRAQGD